MIRADGKEKKRVDEEKTLWYIRQQLNINSSENFIFYEGNLASNKFSLNEEKNIKLKEIIKDNKVYLNKTISIKQDLEVIKEIDVVYEPKNGELTLNSTLDELRQTLPSTLRNERFLKEENGKEINQNEEYAIKISEICNHNIIWMSGKIRDLKDIGNNIV